MIRVALVAAIAAALHAIDPARPLDQPPSSGDLVELDVVALQRDGRPAENLQPSDFEIKDDGEKVEIKTFEAVSADGITEDNERTLVLLLDDSGVPMGGTSVVQGMAARILARARPRDEVTVVRLSNERDEPFGDADTALRRIAEYRAGAVPFQRPGTQERALQVLASMSRQLEAVEHRRKVVACVGSPAVCNMIEPQRGYGLLWDPWVEAMAAAARANVSVYAVMPTVPGSVVMMGGGLADITGGSGFSNTAKFDAFIDTMWLEASHYYLVGYWPPSSRARPLHSIDVKAHRKGVRVRARHQR